MENQANSNKVDKKEEKTENGTKATNTTPKTEASPLNSNPSSNKTESNTAAENIDVSTPCWFYKDSNGLRQGPFSFKEMFLWWKGGFFHSDLMVKTIWEEQFQQLGQIPEFYNAPPKLVERIEREQEEMMRRGHLEVPLVPSYYEERMEEPKEDDQKKDKQYVVVGSFNAMNGKFQEGNEFELRGMPSDKDARMMSYYFDLNAYQTAKQQATDEKKKRKLQKGTKKFWKERKEKKKHAKMIAEYLAD